MNHRLNSQEALSSLRHEISDLRSRLASNSEDGDSLASEDVEWRNKYERLYEAYRRLQKTNISLEDKLLRVVDKFEAEKNQMTRDLAGQTQKLVEAKLTIQRLSDQNRDLHSDLNLSINLLRTRPSSFVSPKIEDLPAEVKSRIMNKGQKSEKSKKILVAVPDSGGDSGSGCVSAAILAKVLEERDKERRAEAKFCIDVGTQTHGWNLNNNKATSATSSPASNSPSITTSSNSSPDGSRRILLASVIHTPKDFAKTVAKSPNGSFCVANTVPMHHYAGQNGGILQRSATFSSTQTDI